MSSISGTLCVRPASPETRGAVGWDDFHQNSAIIYICVSSVSVFSDTRGAMHRAGPAATLPRHLDHVFWPKLGYQLSLYYGYIRCAYPFRHRGMHIFIFFVTKALKLCQVAVVAMLKNCRVPRSGNTCTQWGGRIYVKIIIIVYAKVYKMFIFTVGPKNMERRKLSRLAQMKVFPKML